jgi:hypothetical protein
MILETFSTPAPVISITKDGSNYIIAGHEPFINNKLDQKVFQITDNLNIVRGNHTLLLVFFFENINFKKFIQFKGYGFDVFGSVDLAGFTDIKQWILCYSLQMPANFLMQKLEAVN